jgi:hypothetical protein
MTVNIRRKTIGLDPIKVYLNEMSKMHFQMKKGITESRLYKTD